MSRVQEICCHVFEMSNQHEELIVHYKKLETPIYFEKVLEYRFAFILQELQDISSLGRIQNCLDAILNYMLSESDTIEDVRLNFAS